MKEEEEDTDYLLEEEGVFSCLRDLCIYVP
jgi:hypothetical protein